LLISHVPSHLHSLPTIHSHFTPLFFFNDTAPTAIYTLSLHDALPIFITELNTPRFLASGDTSRLTLDLTNLTDQPQTLNIALTADRKSTRLNSSHVKISYAVFCLKKKKK